MPLCRRKALQLSGLGITILSGCTFGFGGTSDEINVTMTNNDGTTHRLSVIISFENSVLVDETVTLAADESSTTTFENSVLVDETVTLAADESSTTTFENPRSTGSALLEAELDTAERTQTEIRVGPGTGIRDVFVEISADGELTAFAGRT
jgi:hypothetical protein